MEHFYDKKIEELLRQERLPFTLDKEAAWEAIQERIANQSDTPIYTLSRTWTPLKMAAAVAALFAAAAVIVIIAGNVAIDGNEGAITETFLPDGSEVTIKGDGNLAYNAWLWSFDRSVSLEGEAFFEVEEGSTFTVETESGSIEVLGTSFSVLSIGERFEVACKTGRVRVNHDSGKVLQLNPGDAATEREERLEEREISIQTIAVWALDDLNFENIPASELFDTLEELTGYSFVINANIDVMYSGQFSENQSIEDILNIVCLPMNLDYELAGEEVIITNK